MSNVYKVYRLDVSEIQIITNPTNQVNLFK